MLVDGLRNKRFIPPIVHVGWAEPGHVPVGSLYAGKIWPAMRHIDWEAWSTTEIFRKQRVIGPLWNTAEALMGHSGKEPMKAKRIIWQDGFRVLDGDCHLFPSIGHPIIVGLHGNEQKVYVRTIDGAILVADRVKIAGETTMEAFDAVKRTGLAPIPKQLESLKDLPHDFVSFHSPLR